MIENYVIRYIEVPENEKLLEALELCAKFLNLTKLHEFRYEDNAQHITLSYDTDTDTVELSYYGNLSYFIKEVSKIANNLFKRL